MSLAKRILIATASVMLMVSGGCGGVPTAPSQSGATVAGTVSGVGGGALSMGSVRSRAAATAPFQLTVTIAGTSLSSSVDAAGNFHISGVPAGNVQLVISDGTMTATVSLSNVTEQQLIQLQIFVSGGTATIVSEERTSGKVELCHRTENGSYHLIEVSVNAEPAHRAHGDGEVGDPVPADATKVFDSRCRPVSPGVDIEKATNGQDADVAPGPSITVGQPIEWTYVVSNTGDAMLTDVAVTDDRSVEVKCPKATLMPDESMTCYGSGNAALGQYRNVGIVTAQSSEGDFTDSDASHYLGVARDDDEEDGPKVQLCHRTGNGRYHLIEVSVNAEPAHRAHGDAKVGEVVPAYPDRIFTASCGMQ